jgi:hypothetical protein
MNMDRRKTQAKTARLEIELKRLDRNPQQVKWPGNVWK